MWTAVAQSYAFVTGPVRRRWAAFDAWWARKLPGWRGEVASFGLWILFFFFFMPSLLWQPFHIPSRSMENTLLTGDYIFVSKYAYGYSKYSMYPWSILTFDGRIWGAQPKRGDVIVFKLPRDNKTDYIKRLVGMPGDRVQMRGGVLYINGAATELTRIADWQERDESLPEPLQGQPIAQFLETLPGGRQHEVLDRADVPGADETDEFTVPDGHFFFMGDNRDMSADSRIRGSGVGFVPYQNVVGRADLIFFSVKADLRWWQFWRWPFAIRYDRLLTVIS